MKAGEDKTIITVYKNSFDTNRRYDLHIEALKNVKPSIDNEKPDTFDLRCHGPTSRMMNESRNRANSSKIEKENLFLAERIHEIAKKPAFILSDYIHDTKLISQHPGTINFNARLKGAKKIHEQNMAMAQRLEKMKPFFNKDLDMSVFVHISKQNASNREKVISLKRKNQESVPYCYTNNNNKTNNTNVNKKHTTKDNTTVNTGSMKMSNNKNNQQQDENNIKKPLNNILLEYTKIQDNAILDIAVIKEPFRDRYAIFGIDVDTGQRYELRLTSEQVSSILDGDILVTSLDNLEVWMKLLNKITLTKVEQFAKLFNSTDSLLTVTQDNCSQVSSQPSVTPPERVGHNQESGVEDMPDSPRSTSLPHVFAHHIDESLIVGKHNLFTTEAEAEAEAETEAEAEAEELGTEEIENMKKIDLNEPKIHTPATMIQFKQNEEFIVEQTESVNRALEVQLPNQAIVPPMAAAPPLSSRTSFSRPTSAKPSSSRPNSSTGRTVLTPVSSVSPAQGTVLTPISSVSPAQDSSILLPLSSTPIPKVESTDDLYDDDFLPLTEDLETETIDSSACLSMLSTPRTTVAPHIPATTRSSQSKSPRSRQSAN